MKKLFPFIFCLILIGSLILVSCAKTTSTTTAAQPSTSVPASTPAATTTTAATATGGVIKIGHLRPLTGPMAETSQEMIQAFDWAFQRIGYQVAGKQIQIIVGDSQLDPEKAIDTARKMVETDKVAMIVGPIQTGEIMGAAGYLNQVGIPQLVTTGVSTSLINNKWKWTMGCLAEPQTPSPMAAYAYDKLGYRKIDILTGDYAPGHDFLGAFMDTFKKKGGQVVQEIYAPYPTQDFGPYLATLKDADAVAAWLDGDQAIKLLTQYHELGIDKKLPIIGALEGAFLAPYILAALPPADAEAYIGTYVSTPYSPLFDDPFNKQWVSDFEAKFGMIPEDTSASAYMGAMIVINALQATGGDTSPDKLRQAILSVNFDSPYGQVTFDPETGVRHVNIFISKIVKQGNDFVHDPIYTYKDVPATGY